MLDNTTNRAFVALAEQLKLPLLQIAYLSESKLDDWNDAKLTTSRISRQGLRLIDAYLQARTQAQTSLDLASIDSGAVLYDVATELMPLAKVQGFDVVIDKRSKQLVMAHAKSLHTMLLLMGTCLIESADSDHVQPKKIILGTHSSKGGVVVGAFATGVNIGQHVLNVVRKLHGQAHQILPLANANIGVELVIADELGRQMDTAMKSYRHNSAQGFGSLLSVSHQLQLGI